MLQYSTIQYSTVQYSTVQYSTVQYSTVQYSTVQYSTVQYSTVQLQYRLSLSSAGDSTHYADKGWLSLSAGVHRTQVSTKVPTKAAFSL